MSELTTEAYRALLDDLTAAARAFNALTIAISDEELDAAAATVERAEAVGQIFDPTAWIKAMGDGRLERQRILIKAVRDFRAACRQFAAAR